MYLPPPAVATYVDPEFVRSTLVGLWISAQIPGVRWVRRGTKPLLYTWLIMNWVSVVALLYMQYWVPK